MDSGATDLRDKYLQALAAGATARQLWRLFAEHPWYEQELRVCARLALRQRAAPVQWLEDVEHEALVLLARKLQRTPHLQLDVQMAERTFATWLRRIMRHDCLDAVRRLQRTTPPQRELRPEDRITTAETRLLEEHIDLTLLLRRLPARQRAVLLLYSQGFTVGEIAQQSGIDYQHTYRMLQQGLGALRRLLEAEGR